MGERNPETMRHQREKEGEYARSELVSRGRMELTLLLQASSHLISNYLKGIQGCFPGVHS